MFHFLHSLLNGKFWAKESSRGGKDDGGKLREFDCSESYWQGKATSTNDNRANDKLLFCQKEINNNKFGEYSMVTDAGAILPYDVLVKQTKVNNLGYE
jgi:hypothetical protein